MRHDPRSDQTQSDAVDSEGYQQALTLLHSCSNEDGFLPAAASMTITAGSGPVTVLLSASPHSCQVIMS